MNSQFDLVAEFHTKVRGLEAPAIPTLNDPAWVIERTRFHLEEVTEFTDAALDGDMVKSADALADMVYAALGTAWQMGIPFDKIFQHVHTCNMKKVRGDTDRMKNDAIKPEGWVGPEQGIAKLLEDHLE